MKKALRIVPAILLAVGLGACDHGVLDVRPVDRIDESIAITDGPSAEAALLGVYSALQSGDLYGGSFVMFGDLLADNAEHEGTYGTFSEAGRIQLVAANLQVKWTWDALYNAINRANILIERVPTLEAIGDATANRVLAEAHALRALAYHDLVKTWGDVPLVLTPPATVDEAGQVSRSPAADVYARILADLDDAESYFAAAGATGARTRFANPGMVQALRTRVHLWTGDWAAAEAAGDAIVGSYALAPDYASLFAGDSDTQEDIFRLVFTQADNNSFGFFYQYSGRFELGATQDLVAAYPAGDLRPATIFGASAAAGEQEVIKYPTAQGTEDIHVIRFGEVLLNLAEALAQQGGAANLDEAVSHMNAIRVRAGLAPYDRAAGDLPTQQEVLDAIWQERRLELAFEGDRWFQLVRTDRAVSVLGIAAGQEWRTLWPIPQAELDVAPNLEQNPGY